MAKTIDEVLAEFNQVVCDVLRDPSIQLTPESTAKDVKNWDSLHHIEIVIAVEARFKIKFNFSELQKFKNVGQMCDSIVKKVNQAG
jgi:acyl carrier protein